MITKEQHILNQHKKNLEARLNVRGAPESSAPMLRGLEMDYELGERTCGISTGGIGVLHTLVDRIGLISTINEEVSVLKRHPPYFESDHIPTLGYNVICGGHCLQDIELLRTDSVFLDAVGAEHLPAPSTVGDFLRRFDEEAVASLQQGINTCRQKVWRKAKKRLGPEAIIDVDGTIAPTPGLCKEDMDISYKGPRGYAPLIISLANTKETLFLVNRPGNQVSHAGAAFYIDQALALVGPHFKRLYLRGDTDFSLTEHLDRRDDRCTFVFGFQSCAGLLKKANQLTDYQALERAPEYEMKTKPREKPDKVRPERAMARGYTTLRLLSEAVAEFSYAPGKCKKTYRMIVLRKHIAVYKADHLKEIKIRYLFYITNDRKKTPQEIVYFSNERCNQENVIAQLKHGIQALRMPVREFCANRAYMLCASLAWNLKAWYGLLTPDKACAEKIVRMEYATFLNAFIRIPCQILERGRCMIYRILNYTCYTRTILQTFRYFKQLRFT